MLDSPLERRLPLLYLLAPGLGVRDFGYLVNTEAQGLATYKIRRDRRIYVYTMKLIKIAIQS
jgi:hypothetical protein